MNWLQKQDTKEKASTGKKIRAGCVFNLWAEWDLTRTFGRQTAFPMILSEKTSIGVLSHTEFTCSEW